MKKQLILAGVLLSYMLCGQSGNTTDYTANTNVAEKNISKIFPTSPESFRFSQYGNIPIGMFTGAPNINIPITRLAVDNINIPISLNYSSNGINVDEMNGSAGLGWTVLSAGVITRTIRDKPDESSSYNSGDAPLLNVSNNSMIDYLKFCEVDNFDSEPDLYSASFAGHNVKFMIRKNGNIVMMDQKDYKILRNNNGNLFSITVDDGTVYNFNAVENVRNRTLNTGSHQPPLQYPQSWYLTSVVTSKGNVINIEYKDTNYTNILSQSQSMSYTTGTQNKYGESTESPSNNQSFCPITNFIIPANYIGLIADSEQYVSGKQIRKIYDSNDNKIEFFYTDQVGDYSKLINIKKYHRNQIKDDVEFNYMATNSSRLFLTEIKNKISNSSYKLAYYQPHDLPARLSFSRDMWGFYNAKANSNLVPQIFNSTNTSAPMYDGADQSVNTAVGYYGLLKTITYPTGGSTLFNYENHKKKDYIEVPPTENSVGISAFTNSNGSSTSSKEITITPQKTGYVRIGISNFLNESGSCYNNPVLGSGKQRADLEVKNSSGQSVQLLEYSTTQNTYLAVGSSYTVSVNNNRELYVMGEKNQPLKIIVTARWFCSDAYVSATYFNSEGGNILADVILGGYRISSTIDQPNDGIPITRKYKYVKDNGDYSIHETKSPFFKEQRTIASTCPGVIAQSQPLFLDYTVITSSNIGKLFSLNPNIYYETVTEEIEGNGKIVHHFSVDNDEPATIVRGKEILTANLSNTGWNNGKEILTVYKDDVGSVLKTMENNYVEDPSRTYYLGAISRRKFFEPVLSNDTWNNFENLDAVYYKNFSRFIYLKSQKITDFINGIPTSVQTEYLYSNPSHHQLTNQSTSFTDGKLAENIYSYPHEKGNQLMISKNMIGIPLETTTTQTIGGVSKTLGRSETLYPTALPTAQAGNLVLPLSSVSYDVLNNASSTEATYDKYDDKGNLLQYTGKDGILVSIIWGYNKTQPIAKVEGIAYDQLISAVSVSGIVAASDNDAADPAQEGALLSALNNFRKEPALSGKPVSTYTYDLLIGVTSITPPSGVRQTYTYDAAGRLKEGKVRSKDSTGSYINKKVSENNYNYKP